MRGHWIHTTIIQWVLIIVFVGGLTAILFGPRMADFFLADDFDFLWSCSRPGGMFINNGWIAGTSEPVSSYFFQRPFFALSGWVIFQFAGVQPLGWHLANLVLHLLNALLVIVLLRRFIRSEWAGVTAGIIFAVHYLHAEPVLWVSGRTSLLVTFFVLAAIVVETLPRKRTWDAWRWGGLTLTLSAFLTKETAVVLPLLLILVPHRPLTPVDLLPHPVRNFHGQIISLWHRCRHLWPYWLLTGIFLATRISAISAATQEKAYRIEFNLNILKNAAFTGVANLFPLDFRALLAAWNRGYPGGDWGPLVGFWQTHPGTVAAVIAAGLFWLAVFVWGNNPARRFAAWTFVAALPVLFFRGAGERLLYLSTIGVSGTLACLLAGGKPLLVLQLRRLRVWLIFAATGLIISFHVLWLHTKLADWQAAATLSRSIVSALVQLGDDLPPGAHLTLCDLPDNVNGAWVFRTSIKDAFYLYSGRRDVTVTECPSPAGENVHSEYIYRWQGSSFILLNR